MELRQVARERAGWCMGWRWEGHGCLSLEVRGGSTEAGSSKV